MQVVNWLTHTFLHHERIAGYLEPVMQAFKPAWRSSLYRARVISVLNLGNSMVSVAIQIPKNWPIHQAGQHIAVTLEVDGRLITRTFTVASGPALARQHQQIRLVIKQSSLGQFTPNLTSALNGKWLNLSAPNGEFLWNTSAKNVLLLAAGSGITPFIAMLQSLPASTQQRITLLYYAKPGQHILREELGQVSNTLKHLKVEFLNRSQDQDVRSHLSHYDDHLWMACGPSPFYQSIIEEADRFGISVASEHFLATPTVSVEPTQLDVTYQRRTLSMSNTQTLLSQLLDAGEAVTYGCGIGVCHQCKCTKKSGVVRNIKTGQLSDAGQALIQLCISQPVTPLELEV